MRKAVPLLILFFVYAVGISGAGEITVESKIDRVTVYRDRAEVTRVGTVDVPVGAHELSFDALPAGVQADTLRVSGKGSAAVTIGGVEARRAFHAEEQIARVRELRERIEALSDESKRIDGRLNVIQHQQKFLNSIHVAPLKDLPEEYELPKPSLANWEKTLGLLSTGLDDLVENRLALDRQKRNLGREIEAITNERNKVQGMQGRSTVSGVVDVDVERSGSLTLELTYVVRPAYWLPLYDLRLDTDKKRVELTYTGTVTQKTGEDWSNVKLSLSTAQPQVGASAPELNPIHLAEYRAEPSRARPTVERGTLAPAKTLTYGAVGDGVGGVALLGLVDAVPEQAAMMVKGPLVLFEVPGREEIPSDGNPHRATVAIESFTAKLEHVAVPKMVAHTFLKAKLTNRTDTPFLAGKTNVFVGGNFVGSGWLDAVAPTEKFEVGFGADESVKVERTELKDLKGKSGIFKNRKSIARGYEIKIANYRDESVRLTLFDQVPVAKDEEIKVKFEESSIKPTEQTELGVLSWKLKLKPREEKELQFEYLVEHPKNRRLVGLD